MFVCEQLLQLTDFDLEKRGTICIKKLCLFVYIMYTLYYNT